MVLRLPDVYMQLDSKVDALSPGCPRDSSLMMSFSRRIGTVPLMTRRVRWPGIGHDAIAENDALVWA